MEQFEGFEKFKKMKKRNGMEWEKWVIQANGQFANIKNPLYRVRY